LRVLRGMPAPATARAAAAAARRATRGTPVSAFVVFDPVANNSGKFRNLTARVRRVLLISSVAQHLSGATRERIGASGCVEKAEPHVAGERSNLVARDRRQRDAFHQLRDCRGRWRFACDAVEFLQSFTPVTVASPAVYHRQHTDAEKYKRNSPDDVPT